ncbi:MAG: glycosyltransferase family 2 protein [Gelidibacter sp.]
MRQPLVSILTPFKNTGKFLPQCVESILKQTHTNWELLIIDDHSTDDSCEIVNNFAKKDPRIKLLKNDGHGIIDALRLAFKHSKGDYITRMDSDDVMTADKLKVLLDNLLEKGIQHLAVGLVNYFSDEGISDGYGRYERWLNGLTVKGENYSGIYKECVIPSPCWMIHRDDLIACNAFNPNRYPEDYDLTFRFYKHQMICVPCDKVLHHWRDYATRTSRTHEHYAQNYFLDIKLHYFLELDYDESRVLTVWGAGFKGKHIAKLLKKRNVPFIWICNNPKKISKHIYGIELQSFTYLNELHNPQSIVTVANEQSQERIKTYFSDQNMKSMTDYFFFC